MADKGRNGRAVECGGLENRCPAIVGPGVRIPLSPLKLSSQTRRASEETGPLTEWRKVTLDAGDISEID